ncbi:MAG TPA: NapC/NirT family cytochrome c, partial [Phycisphaerae bacterium]|nr:NapC/NirT family cytochrome c [Phycisphaerae bacterium]
TITGMYLAVIALILLLTFGLFSVVSPASNSYIDIFGYLGIPVVMALGVAMMIIGIVIKSWRVRRKDPTQHIVIRLPRIDLNDPQQRSFALVMACGIFLLLPILGVASYYGYHYTDSVQFCANACHAVMEPQGTAFARSSHARVACAECHIGSGASWFVKSKLSGTRQVFKVLFNSYDRPIPPAIRHLRPARDTCEQCHWPKKFFGSQLRSIAHFASNEENTRTDVQMLVKTGGERGVHGEAEGIHAHMLELGIVEYVATDDYLQKIEWVRWVRDGKETIFRSDGLPATDPPPTGRRRQMDCMDCHNRPGHKFVSPNAAVNEALADGRLDPALPYIKREAVNALVVTYPDVDAARAGITQHLETFYQKNYADRVAKNADAVSSAADVVYAIYRANIFPYMRVDWRTYPDNIGHFISPGCYRCHDGKHVTDDGVAIGHQCDTCHTFLNPVKAPSGHEFISEGEFVHPFKLQGVHQQLRCDKCHTGGPEPVPTCGGCHHEVQSVYDASAPELARFSVDENPMSGLVDCTDCHDLDKPVSLASVNEHCLECHDDHTKYGGMLEKWEGELHDAYKQVDQALLRLAATLADQVGSSADEDRKWLEQNQATVDLLRKANGLHNADAALDVLKTITHEAEERAKKLSAPAARQATVLSLK